VGTAKVGGALRLCGAQKLRGFLSVARAGSPVPETASRQPSPPPPRSVGPIESQPVVDYPNEGHGTDWASSRPRRLVCSIGFTPAIALHNLLLSFDSVIEVVADAAAGIRPTLRHPRHPGSDTPDACLCDVRRWAEASSKGGSGTLRLRRPCSWERKWAERTPTSRGGLPAPGEQ